MPFDILTALASLAAEIWNTKWTQFTHSLSGSLSCFATSLKLASLALLAKHKAN